MVRPSDRDPALAKRAVSLSDDWALAQRKALDHVHDVLDHPEKYAGTKWSDRDIPTALNLKIAETIGLDIRAKAAAGTGPKLLGVVMMQPQVAASDWEKMVAEQRRIDAIPTEEIHGDSGSVGGVSEQLGGGVQEEKEPQK